MSLFDFSQGNVIKSVSLYHNEGRTTMGLTVFFESCLDNVNLAYGLPFGLFLMGLVSGFTHCIGMCGPFVMAQGGNLTRVNDVMLVPYHLGRVTTYTILAVIMASLVNVLEFFSPIRVLVIVPLLSLAGLLFIVNAIPKLQIMFPWVNRLGLITGQKHAQKLFSKSNNRFFMGMALGLMPCGMVMGAIIAASTATSYLSTVMSMVAFGVGTIPALVIVVMGGQKLQQKFPNKMPTIRAGFMIWSGLWLFTMAGLVVLRG